MNMKTLLLICLALIIFPVGVTNAAGRSTIDGHATDDTETAGRNAVVSLGHCSGTLITDLIVLTAAHCVPVGLRVARPDDNTTVHCSKLWDQHKLQARAWEDPMVWHPIPPRKTLSIAFGVDRARQRMPIKVRAYSIPRCADIALLQLVRRASKALVTPMKVLTKPSLGTTDFDALLLEARLYYAGWGLGKKSPKQLPNRQTGRVSYWDRNACLLFTLPPERSGGERIVGGDSGSPLIMRHRGTDLVVGVLFGRGLPDSDTCGRPLLPPPQRHGAYTPTFRGAIPGTEATDLAAWLAHFAPEAIYPPRATNSEPD